MTSFQLNRRALLRGAVSGMGAAIALPALDAMLDSHGTAYADGTLLPRRFGIWFWGNGNYASKWVPKTTGAGWEPSEQLMPLSANKDYVTVVTGMEGKLGNAPGHHTGRATILTASYDPKGDTYGAPVLPSIDQLLAKEWNGRTKLPSLELGVSKSGPGCGCESNRQTAISGPNTYLPTEQSPLAVFTRLFGTNPGDPNAAKLLAAQKSVLDAVSQDARALQSKLGAADRTRLDAHLQGIRDLEHQLETGPSVSCVTPAKPGDYPKTNGHEQITAINKAMVDLLAMALTCDLTRVFNFAFMGMQADTIFWEAGINDQMHAMTHDSSKNAQSNQAMIFIMSQLNVFLTKLRATPEGAGNLLDSCCILGTSDVANPGAHDVIDYPILLAGRAGGALRSGYHYRSPGAPRGQTTSMALLTAMRAAGSMATGVGKDAGQTSTVISELLM
jgi:hypothetical protein